MFLMIKIADRRVLWRHFRSTSGFIGCWKFLSQKFLLYQKIRRKISGGVLGSIFHLWPHLVGVITDFDPYVSKLTNKSATVNKISIKAEKYGNILRWQMSSTTVFNNKNSRINITCIDFIYDLFLNSKRSLNWT